MLDLDIHIAGDLTHLLRTYGPVMWQQNAIVALSMEQQPGYLLKTMGRGRGFNGGVQVQ